jgi:hypothetical protein
VKRKNEEGNKFFDRKSVCILGKDVKENVADERERKIIIK